MSINSPATPAILLVQFKPASAARPGQRLDAQSRHYAFKHLSETWRDRAVAT